VISVHLKGTYLCTQAAGRAMKLIGNGGRIVNTTSLSGLLGNFGQANYSAAKAGIYGLTRTASLEFAKFNVNVNAVAPVAITRMTEDLPMMKGLSAEALGPQHIAPLVAFLASDLAKDVTGRIFGVHGAKVFEYKMEQSEGVTKDGGMWTPEEIKERLPEISKL
jgi:NAD(P)-dependent dehydrogenase (short-subunit alcohol dehydrogenase family)